MEPRTSLHSSPSAADPRTYLGSGTQLTYWRHEQVSAGLGRGTVAIAGGQPIRRCGPGPTLVDDPRILYYVPQYLHRSQRFIWQQARDLPSAHVGTLELLETADEFPHPSLTVIRPQSRLVRSLDFRSRKVLRRAGMAPSALAPTEIVRLTRLLGRSDLAYTMFLQNAFDLLLPARISRTPIVVHAAGSDVTTARWRGSAYLDKVSRVFRQADLVLCGSSFLREQVLQLGCAAQKCEVHYLGIDLPSPQTTQRRAADPALRVAAVSRLHAVKGVHHSISAFAMALGGTTASLTIVGDGPEREALVDHARTLQVAEQVVFTGEQPHSQVYEVLTNSDIFIQHNTTTPEGGAEGLGGTLLEAAAHGLPVITTTSGGASEALLDGKSGYVVPEGSVGDMADRLLELAEDPAGRAEMGRRGRRYVETTHNAATQNRRLATRLQQLMSDPR